MNGITAISKGFGGFTSGFIRNRIHVVACAAAATWAWAQLTQTPLTIANLCIISLLIFCIYQWNRIFDLAEDWINSPLRAWYSRRWKSLLIFSCMVGTGYGLVYPLMTSNYRAFLLVLLVILLAYLYSTPISPPLLKNKIRLKEIPVIKNLTSGIGWMILTVVYPPVYVGQHLKPVHWIGAGMMLGAVWMVELIWDIRDRKGDRMADISTIPVLKGVRGARLWLRWLNGISGIGLLISYVLGLVPAYWLFILANNLLVYVWQMQSESTLINRRWSHLLVGLQTLLLVLLGMLAGNAAWMQAININ